MDWSVLVPRLVNPTKVFILEAMLWVERPLSATELAKLSGGDPDLSMLSYHLKNLGRLGVLEVVAECKARKSQSSKKEKFFYFSGESGWIVSIAHLRDPDDPLTEAALSLKTAGSARRHRPPGISLSRPS